MAEETKKPEEARAAKAEVPAKTEKAAGGPPRPMARIAARVAFYVGVLSLVAGIAVKYVGTDRIAIRPSTFLTVAMVWLLMAVAILLAEIERKIR